jgi:septal ring factor EnvC (AmiA/AmiB activator)
MLFIFSSLTLLDIFYIMIKRSNPSVVGLFHTISKEIPVMIGVKHSTKGLSLALLLSGAMVLVSCSSSPDEAEMRQLNDMKEEYAALQKESAAKEAEKAALEKEIAEKNAKLKKCSDDQQVVRQRLGQ